MGAGEEWLNRYIEAKAEALRLQDKIKELRADAVMPGKELDGMPHGSGKNDLSGYAARLLELEEKYTEQWRKAKLIRGEIVALVAALFRGKQRELFINRYLLGVGATANAKLIRVSRTHFYRLWKAGLRTVDRCLEETRREQRRKLDGTGPGVI